MPDDSRPPTRYDLRVTGHLDPHWSGWFGGSVIIHHDDGTTVVRCVVTDQAELHGLLVKVRDLGATLVSVTPVDADDPHHRSGGNSPGPCRPGHMRSSDEPSPPITPETR